MLFRSLKIRVKGMRVPYLLMVTSLLSQYHIGKLSLSQEVGSCQGMEDLESALKSLEVKMVGENNNTDVLVRVIYNAT